MIDVLEQMQIDRNYWKAKAEGEHLAWEAVQEENDRLRERVRWVSVDERLPEEGKLVLIFTANKTIETRRLIASEKYKWWEFGTSCCGFEWGTHWMPLPSNPKEAEKNMSLLEELLAERGIKIANPNEKPKCFKNCDCGDMSVGDHCTNRNFPVMSKCVNCHFYFGYLEKRKGQSDD